MARDLRQVRYLVVSGSSFSGHGAASVICEFALAHVNNDRVKPAYRRSDLIERCRTLMQQWDDYFADNA